MPLTSLKLQPCLPPWWARDGHSQTIAGHLIPSPKIMDPGERLEISVPGGDRLIAYANAGKSDFVVSLFHGLSGDITGDYMQRTSLLCAQLGHTCVRVNHRGAGEGLEHARESYHSGRGEDISAVIEFLRARYPGKKQIAVGFSMSGNILLYLLSGQRGTEKPDGAIAVNGAINLETAAKSLLEGWNRLYDLRFVKSLSADLRLKYKKGLIPEVARFPWGTSVYDMDRLYTASANGFESREHYYATCSSQPHVSKIKTPTYVLTAADDPFVKVKDYEAAQWPACVSVHIEKHGGHMGYYSRKKTPLGSRRWLDYYIHEALQALVLTI